MCILSSMSFLDRAVNILNCTIQKPKLSIRNEETKAAILNLSFAPDTSASKRAKHRTQKNDIY